MTVVLRPFTAVWIRTDPMAVMEYWSAMGRPDRISRFASIPSKRALPFSGHRSG